MTYFVILLSEQIFLCGKTIFRYQVVNMYAFSFPIWSFGALNVDNGEEYQIS